MKKLFYLCISVLISGISYPQIIPGERTADWSVAGNAAQYEDPQSQVSVMNFGAAGNGTANDAPAVNDAIASFNGQPGIVFFPPGDYLIEDPLSLPSGIILRGVDSLSTNILIDFDGEPQDAITISGNAATGFQDVMSGYTEGSHSLVVEDAAEFAEGDYAELLQDNGAWYTEPASWAENAVGQILKIIGVDGNTITFMNALRIDYDAALHPRIRKIEPVKNVAIENLRIERMDEPQEGAGSNISINLSSNIRIRDIESDKSVGSHINVHRSSQIWLTGSYIHHAFTYDGSGTRGYGITLSMHTGECLIANNVFNHLRHAMMVKTGSNGNVFAYNYSIEPYRSETIHDYSGDISLHGHYAFDNLFEGNIVQNIIIDHYWGTSGPHNTFFRNRAELYGFIITSSGVATDQQNIVGLEITNTDFLYGLYQLEGEDHLEYGNNVNGDFEPFFTDSLPDSSYYLTVQPAFWNISDPWPSIGVPMEYNTWSIPAKERFLGNITRGESLIESRLSIYPNPCNSFIRIQAPGAGHQKVNLTIRNLTGAVVFSRKVQSNRQISIAHLPDGIYLVSLQSGAERSTTKIVKNR